MKHIARKRFGQHFLTDQALIDSIVSRINPLPHEDLVEIGPGLGAITRPLLDRCGTLTVIELDRDLAAHWARHQQVRVLESDVLKVDFGALVSSGAHLAIKPGNRILRLVGNLPYNISTPILFHLLPWAHLVTDQHFMLQKEVVDRMVAKPATSEYGRLSVMMQWRYSMDHFLQVPPQAFDPPPRVNSSVVAMRPIAQPPPVQLHQLETVVRVAFAQRRKLLRHSLGKWLEERGFDGDFDLQRRAEEVPVDQYVALAQRMDHSPRRG